MNTPGNINHMQKLPFILALKKRPTDTLVVTEENLLFLPKIFIVHLWPI